MSRDQCSKFHFMLLFKRKAVTITHEGARIHRMLSLYLSIPLLFLSLTRGNPTSGNELLRNQSAQTTEPDVEQIRSPLMEVFMGLPRNFRDASPFKNAPGIQSNGAKRNADRETIVEVSKYEIKQPIFIRGGNHTFDSARNKREADPQETEAEAAAEKPEPQKLVSVHKKDLPDGIRGHTYKTFPVKEFDVVDIDDPDDPRRRRIDSSNDPEDNAQRDKRKFLEEGSGETTTLQPFWKRKKENPPFVTGRVGSNQNGNGYTPAQHRAGESSRESHSLKNLDKTVQSNEISRSNQDSYYSATNRRTYGRHYDGPTSSTPKSVYDTIDYSTKSNADPARGEFPRNQDEKESPRERRLQQTHEQYSNRPYTPPWMYDRPYYQPAYPYPTEVLGRGVEYYHRTYDPTTGRIIYYANMPEQGRSYEYRYMDPINRSFYLSRPYPFDPYYRNYVPPFDYRFVNGFGDYRRHGRSGSQAYSYPYQEREKYMRDARFVGGFETGNRLKDELRNRTYVIYDADESRSQFSRPQYTVDNNRLAHASTPSSNNPPRPQFPPLQQFPFSPPPADYFPPPAFPNRNSFYSPGWGFGHRSLVGVADSNSNSNSRPPHSPEVQLPLTTSNRGDLEKPKKP